MKRLFIILSIILLINSYYANSQIEYTVRSVSKVCMPIYLI